MPRPVPATVPSGAEEALVTRPTALLELAPLTPTWRRALESGDSDSWYDRFSDDTSYDGIQRLGMSQRKQQPAAISRPVLNADTDSWYDRFSDDSSYDGIQRLGMSQGKRQPAAISKPAVISRPVLNADTDSWYDRFSDDSSYDTHISYKEMHGMPPIERPPRLETSKGSSSLGDSAGKMESGSSSKAILLTTVAPGLGALLPMLLLVWMLRRRRQASKSSELPIVNVTPGENNALGAVTSRTSSPSTRPPSTGSIRPKVKWTPKPSLPLVSGRISVQRAPRPPPQRQPRGATISPSPAALERKLPSSASSDLVESK